MPLHDDAPTHVSLFAGIDGIGLGLERAGFRTIASVEIDRFCNRVRAKRQPHVPQFGDIREFGRAALANAALQSSEQQQSRHAGEDAGRSSIDILSGGFPCQDLSVAGKRAGLAGARSGLFYEFVRVARELRPRWLLVENVPGLLSSNDGRDFAIVLRELGDAGYFVEWRVLDSRWFGVAQRRRRVFLVGHLGGPPARPVLFELEGGSGDPAARDEERAIAAGTLARSVSGPGGGQDIGANKGNVIVSETVTHALTSGGADASEDGTGRGTPLVIAPPHAATLSSGSHPNSSAPSRHREDDENLVLSTKGNDAAIGRDLSTPLNTDGDAGSGPIVFRKSRRAADPNDDETWVPADEANTLNDFDQGDVRTTHAVIASSVRRLTPTECERLQGFPDGWTCLCDADPCTCPDGPRYAALGNAVTVPVPEWIGRQISAVEALT